MWVQVFVGSWHPHRPQYSERGPQKIEPHTHARARAPTHARSLILCACAWRILKCFAPAHCPFLVALPPLHLRNAGIG